MKQPEIRHLPIRSCTVLEGDGAVETRSFVFCPLRERAETTSHCERCPSLVTLEPARVSCELPPVDGRHVDAAELAARLCVGEVMRRDVVAVTADVDLVTVSQRLVDGAAGCVVVVDAKRAVLGLISKTDALRERAERGDAGQAAPRELGRGFHVADVGQSTAGDVMVRAPLCLPEDARLSHAIGLMATDRLAHLPVVDADGVLVGVLDSDDVLAWFAKKIGY
ncbi:MAG: CBS domain-containing protein [Myxococcales bacterium]|jgi:CBS domain-containing protein|nr:CBS domain-containing protein [Myxococcales bacterium]MBL0195335.1 CBS domain-containing protein [Myxococcales bacterium]